VAFVMSREQTTPKDLAEHLGASNDDAGKMLRRLSHGAAPVISKISRGVYGPGGARRRCG
jgi:hypothetical protein